MSSISQAYTNALLADATYALGVDGQPDATGEPKQRQVQALVQIWGQAAMLSYPELSTLVL